MRTEWISLFRSTGWEGMFKNADSGSRRMRQRGVVTLHSWRLSLRRRWGKSTSSLCFSSSSVDRGKAELLVIEGKQRGEEEGMVLTYGQRKAELTGTDGIGLVIA